MICSTCGAANRDGARFCDSCGAALAAPEAAREVRKTVTVLFCDVTGSTALGERLDPEATRKLMARYFEQARTILERHGASVEKFIGDAVMAVFGIPQVHEDDALRAARAALELRAAVDELELRIGVNTGEVVTGSGETLVTGDAVNVAARLEQAAQPGEVLIGEPTYRLVRDAVEAEPVEPLAAKGKTEPLAAYRLLAVREGADSFARRLDAPLVGRARELRLLREALGRAIEERSSHLFTLLGTAGVGKSRLAQELVDGVGDGATILTGRCLPYGEGITYWPLIEMFRTLGAGTDVAQLLEGVENARTIVNGAFGAIGIVEGGAVDPEETFWSVRKLFEALAREQPLVVLLDDLHWGEPTFLDLVEHVADWSRDAPILLLCLARAELLDARPSWGGGKHNATSLLLEPLSESETQELIDKLLARVDDETRRRVADAAEGNPLFVEQMLAMIDEGVDAGVPPTIQALLAARLDRLPPSERSTLERAAVIGKEFWRSAVVELGGDTGALPPLVRKELIRPHATVLAGEDGFRFRHQLIRDAAYDAMPKELRAELHEQFADWIERQRSEHDEIVGYHLEQAFRYREQLGPIGEREHELACRAGERLFAAGRRADARDDEAAAVNLLERTVALLPRDSTTCAQALAILATWMYVRRPEDGQRLFSEAIDAAAASEARGVEAASRVALDLNDAFYGRGSLSDVAALANRLIPTLDEDADDLWLAWVYDMLGIAETNLGRSDSALGAWQRAQTLALHAGDRARAMRIATHLGLAYVSGPTPVPEAIEQLERVLAEVDLSASCRARIHAKLAWLKAAIGETDVALALATDSRRLLAEIGNAYAALDAAHAEHLAGDLVAAERGLRSVHELLATRGEHGIRATVARDLAETLVAQGLADDEVEALTRVSQELVADDDADVQAGWRRVRARVLATRGEVDEAERLAREAVAILEPTDFLDQRGRAALDLAHVLAAAGRPEEAATAAAEAHGHFQAKGNVVSAGWARGLLDELVAEPLAERE